MKRFLRVSRSVILWALILSFVLSCLPVQEAKAFIVPSIFSQKAVRDEDGPGTNGQYYHLESNNSSLLFTTLNGVAVDQDTLQPIAGVGLYLYSESEKFHFERSGTTESKAAAVFEDVILNLTPSEVSDFLPNEHMYFGVGSVPRDYKHPKNATLGMDLYFTTPDFDELIIALEEAGWSHKLAKIIIKIIEYGSDILDFLLPFSVSEIKAVLSNTVMPKWFMLQFEDPVTGQKLPADIRYKDYDFFYPRQAKYWMQVELEKKTCDPITIIIPSPIADAEYRLLGGDGEEVPLTRNPVVNNELTLTTPADQRLALGSYQLLIDSVSENYHEIFGFDIQGIAFPTKEDGTPDYKAFQAMEPIEQEILKKHDPDHYDHYYDYDYGSDYGKREYSEKDNDWTMIRAGDGSYTDLVEVDPTAVDHHVLRLSKPSDQYWLSAVWYGDAPAADTELALNLFKRSSFSDTRTFLKTSLSEVAPAYLADNEKLRPASGQPEFDSDDRTLVYISENRASATYQYDGVTVWESPIYLPEGFANNNNGFGAAAASGLPDGWTAVTGSGVRYSSDMQTRVTSITTVFYQDPVTLQFRKRDMNGETVEPYPSFVLRDTLSSDATLQNSIAVPVTVDSNGLYSVSLRKGAQYTLSEIYTGTVYARGANWTVNVSDTGGITVEPQNSTAGEAVLASDGIFDLTDLYAVPRAFHLSQIWTDMAGSRVDPPDGVEAVRVHLDVYDNKNERVVSVDRVLKKEDNWTDLWYANRVTSVSAKAYLTEVDWLDKDGNVISRSDDRYISGGQATADVYHNSTDINIQLRSIVPSAGLLKMEGTEARTDYTFVREWDGKEIVWNAAEECYPLIMTGEDIATGTYNSDYVLDEYDPDGTLVGKWSLSFYNGSLSAANPSGFTVNTGDMKPSAQKVNVGGNVQRLVLFNPAETYNVRVTKEWDPSFLVYSQAGNLEIDYRAERVTFTFTPIGIGTTTEDMKPIPEDVYLRDLSVVVYPGAPTGTVSLVRNVIYKVTESDNYNGSFTYSPFYRVVDADGRMKTEWVDCYGSVMTGDSCAVVTEEDTAGTVYAYNNHGTFTVNVHIDQSANDNDVSSVWLVLEKKVDGVWTEAAHEDLYMRNESSGIFLRDKSFTFTDIDLTAEYRVRVAPRTVDSSTHAVAAEDTALICRDNNALYTDGTGTTYNLTYDDSKNSSFVQGIRLSAVSGAKIRATVRWYDANDRDNIRPDTFTAELLYKQTGTDGSGNTVTDWLPVTDRNGVAYTKEIRASDLTTTDYQDYITFTFEIDSDESRTYRVRVKEGTRDGSLVRFGSDSLYEETFTDSASQPQTDLTAKKEYKVEKKWDVDIEGLDVPDSLSVVLQKKSDSGDWGDPAQALVLTAKDGWKGTFKPVDRYDHYMSSGFNRWKDSDPEYRVRETKEAPLKGKLAGLLDGLEDSAVKALGLPDFITNFAKGLLPANKDTEKKIYDWICNAGKDTAIGKQLRQYLQGEIVEDGKYITLKVSRYYSPIAGEYEDEHNTKYKVSYKTSGNTTVITNLAVEDVTLWKLWVGIDEDDRPDSVYLVLTSKIKGPFAEEADSLGIPLVGDYTPVINPIEGDRLKIDLLITEWTTPLAVTEVKKSDNKGEIAWKAEYTVKKYGESGLPQEFKGAEGVGYMVSEVAKTFFGTFLGPIADLFDYVSFNFLDTYLTVSTPALRMPDLVAQIGSTLGYDGLSGLHSAVVNTWIHDDSDDTPFIGGRKIWQDENDADGIRPSSVTVHIYEKKNGGKGKELGTAKASASTYWTWSFCSDALDEDKTYIIEEEAVDGYSVTYDGYDIINTHEVVRTNVCDVSIVKNWNGDAPADIEKLTVALTADGAVLTEVDLTGPDWTYTFSGLDLTDENGNRIEYSVLEEEIPGYIQDPVTRDEDLKDGVTVYTLTLNNRPDPDAEALFRVIKKWDNDKASDRPGEIKVTVAADTGTFTAELTLTAADGWTAETEVPLRAADGTLIGYSVTEDTPLSGYTTDIGLVLPLTEDGRTVYECTVTNTYGGKPEELSARFVLTKEWKDVPAADRPASVTLTVTGSDGTEEKVTLTEAGGWTAVIDPLPYAAADGTRMEWTVTEETLKGFLTEIGPVTSETSNKVVTYSCTVTNSIDPEPDDARIPLVAEKIWKDGLTDDQRPESLTWVLTGTNGMKRTAHVTAEDGWKHIFHALPYYDNKGNTVIYTLTEDVPDQYTCTVSPVVRIDDQGTVTYNVTVTNTLEPARASFTVTKEWKNDDWLNRPAQVTVYLLADGAVKDSHALTEAGNWTWTWEDLPILNSKGDEIEYTVTEKAVSGYTFSAGPVKKETRVGGDVLYSCTLTNTADPAADPMTVRIVKVWSGDDPADRPDVLSLELSAGTFFRTVLLDDSETDADGNWITSIRGLPRTDASGEPLNWALTEDVPDGYACDISGKTLSDSEYQFTVTNTAVTVLTDLTVIKEWDDASHEYLRPDPVTLEILRDGSETGVSVTLTESNGWRETVEDMPRYAADGSEYVYSLREPDTDGLYSFTRKNSPEGDTLVLNAKNTLRLPGKAAVLRVTKVWEECDGQQKDHDPVTLLLHENGNPREYRDLEKNGSGEWTGEWKVPLLDDAGKIISWSVTEDVPEGYTYEVSPVETTVYGDTTVYSFAVTNSQLYSTVTYELAGDPVYGIPESLTAPVDDTRYPLGATVTVLPGQTTTWTTVDGTAAGMKGSWTFDGWLDADDKPVTVIRDLREDTAVYGSWAFDPATFSLTYETEGDPACGKPSDEKLPAAVTGIAWKGSVTLEDPLTTVWTTADGAADGMPGSWTFEGWTDAAGTPVTVVADIREDTSVYGVWAFTPDTYSLTYETEGDPVYGKPGDEVLPSPVTDIAWKGSVTLEDPLTTAWSTADGAADGMKGSWTFTGWLDANSAPVTVVSGIRTDTAVYGVWAFTPDTYTLTYETEGDPTYGKPSDEKLPAAVTGIAWKGSVTLADILTTVWTTADGAADGMPGVWTFTGWLDESDLLTALISDITGNITVRGAWAFTPDTFTLTYRTEGDPTYGKPSDEKLPAAVTGIAWKSSVTLADALTTAFISDDGTDTGIPGFWYFDGWFEDEDYLTPVTDLTVTADRGVYGYWTFLAAGNLSVETVVAGNGGDPDDEFGYRVTLLRPLKMGGRAEKPLPLAGEYNALFTDRNGKVTPKTVTVGSDGVIDLVLKAGEKLEILRVASGLRYRAAVTNGNEDKFYALIESLNSTGVIGKGKTTPVKFTHAKWTGDLELTMSVKGDKALTTDLFTYEITLTGPDGKPLSGSYTVSYPNGTSAKHPFTDGKISVSLSAGACKDGPFVIRDLPEGTAYVSRVTAGNEAFGYSVSSAKGTKGTVVRGEACRIAYVHLNEAEPYQYPFIFYKKWNTNDADHPAARFVLYYASGDICRPESQPPRLLDAEKGLYAYYFPTDDVEDMYVVEVSVKGYSASYSNVQGNVYENMTDRAGYGGTITNAKIPPTGDSASPVLWGALCGLALLVIAVILKRKR